MATRSDSRCPPRPLTVQHQKIDSRLIKAVRVFGDDLRTAQRTINAARRLGAASLIVAIASAVLLVLAAMSWPTCDAAAPHGPRIGTVMLLWGCP